MVSTYIQDEHIFRNTLKKFLEQEAYPHFEKWEKAKEIPREFWIKMGEKGFLCPWVDENYGGLGADFIYSVILNEELERVGQGGSWRGMSTQ